MKVAEGSLKVRKEVLSLSWSKGVRGRKLINIPTGISGEGTAFLAGKASSVPFPLSLKAIWGAIKRLWRVHRSQRATWLAKAFLKAS